MPDTREADSQELCPRICGRSGALSSPSPRGPFARSPAAQQYFHLAAGQPDRHLLRPAGLQVRQPLPSLPWTKVRSKWSALVSAHYCKLRAVSSTGSASFPHETINLALRHPHHSFSRINLKYESTRLPPVLLLPESTLSPPCSAPYLRQRVTAILWSTLQAQALLCANHAAPHPLGEQPGFPQGAASCTALCDPLHRQPP